MTTEKGVQNLNVSNFKCSHFYECAGCCEILSGKVPPIWDEILGYFAFFNCIPHLHQGSPIHWRYRAKLAVRGSSSHPSIGLFKKYSHDVLPIPFCRVHHPQLNRAFEIVKQWISKNFIVPYNEKNGQGDLRYLQGVVHRETGRVQLTFVFNALPSNLEKEWCPLIRRLGDDFSDFWHSLWINYNDKQTNTIFGKEWNLVWGENHLWEQFGNVSVCYGPASFGQANLCLFEQMLSRIKNLLSFQACVTEYYAGVGVIGLFIASECEWVRCGEINPSAQEYFLESRSRLDKSVSSKIEFFSESTEKTFYLLKDATAVIVDPPRKGLEYSFFEALDDAEDVQQLLYVSCGWEAFKRDCEKLASAGWKIISVDGYHFFPGSDHIELLVNFKK